MGFVFRSIFWLSLALVMVPPHARLGGDEEVEWRDIDIDVELHNAAYALWGLIVHTASTCETNHELCAAAGDIADKAVETAADLATEVTPRGAEKPMQVAESRAAPHKKIQTRVE